MANAQVQQAADVIEEAVSGLTEKEKLQAVEAAGVPMPSDVPDSAWNRMSGRQVLTVLIVMFVGMAALFGALLWFGVDLATADEASEAAKTLGTTIVGAALGMIGAAGVGAGATKAAGK